MNKHIVLSAIATVGFVMVSLAQTIVSTQVENRNAVLEMFTGMYCGNCPRAHRYAQELADYYLNDFFVITLHAGALAAPDEGLPDYRTEYGEVIANQAGIPFWPSGTISRHVFEYSVDTGMTLSEGRWDNALNHICNALPSYVNVAATATIVKESRQMQVLVEAYYTGDSPVQPNYLNVALLQDSIVGYQSGEGDTYNHMHMLRDMLTGQWGMPIPNTSLHSFFSTSLRYDIPESIRDIDVVLDHLHLVVFVAEGTTEIITAYGVEIIMLDNVSLDAAVTACNNLPQAYCGGELNPVVTVHNYGTDAITSFDIEYTVNNEAPMTYAWTGDLDAKASTEIALPSYPLLSDIQDINNLTISLKNPNGDIDKLPANNVLVKELGTCVDATEDCKLVFDIPDGAEEVTWELVTSNGDVLLSGGPYNANAVYEHAFSFPESDIYALKVHDAGGDAFGGNGSIKFFNMSKSEEVWEADMEAWRSELVAEFRYNPEGIEDISVLEGINLYPNPASEIVTLTYVLPHPSKVNIELYDMFGKQQSFFTTTKIAGLHQHTINVSDLRTGLYIIHFNIDGQQVSKKISVVK